MIFLKFSFVAQCPTKELPSQSMLICLLATVAWGVQLKYPTAVPDCSWEWTPVLSSTCNAEKLHFLGTAAVPDERIWALSWNTGVPQWNNVHNSLLNAHCRNKLLFPQFLTVMGRNLGERWHAFSGEMSLENSRFAWCYQRRMGVLHKIIQSFNDP